MSHYFTNRHTFSHFRSSDSSRARRSADVRRKQQQRCRHLNNLNNSNSRPSYETDAVNTEGNVNGGGCVVVTLADLCPRNTVVNSSGDAVQHKVLPVSNIGPTFVDIGGLGGGHTGKAFLKTHFKILHLLANQLNY